MHIREFIDRWRDSAGAERANSQSFLNELCDLLGVERPHPATGDAHGDTFVFERDALIPHEGGKVTIGKIDLYKQGCFILEAKQGSQAGSAKLGTARRGTPAWNIAMRDAFGQALGYAKTIRQPPPFIVVCDVGFCFDLYATFEGTWNYRPFPDALTSRLYVADLEKHTDRLRAIFTDPFALDPSRNAAKVTREIATHIATLARALECEGREPERVAKFLMRCLFTMFAEDIDLLPRETFVKMLDRWIEHPDSFVPEVEALWATMNEGGSLPFVGKILHFNGGLFSDPAALPLSKDKLIVLGLAARSNWAEVEPAIFGTLLERALDPRERHRLGAHYTPRAYVERLVRPTIEEPLRAEWEIVQAEVRQIIAAGKSDDDRKAMVAARKPVYDLYDRLRKARVLDPACGSGNFLFVALDAFKRLENEILDLLHDLGDEAVFITHGAPVSPEQFLGIEIKPWAKEITELVLWIGYLQWQIRTRGWKTHVPEPVLRDYHNIECRDAVLAYDGVEPVLDGDGKAVTRWDGETMKIHPATGKEVPDESARVPVVRYINPREAEWPTADFVVGNPPFVGNKRMRLVLGDGYVEALRSAHDDVPETADYVMYWWNYAALLLRSGAIRRFGLITTNSITQVFNRKVVQAHLDAPDPISIVFAVPDHPWVDSVDGAAVRVAMTSAIRGTADGTLVTVVDEHDSGSDTVNVTLVERRGRLRANLEIGSTVDIAQLRANENLAFRGVTLVGDGFFVDPVQYMASEAVRQLWGARTIIDGAEPRQVIDLFGLGESEARLSFAHEFQHLYDTVRPKRLQQKRRAYAEAWWIFAEPRPALRAAIAGLPRYIATVETAKHRWFVTMPAGALPEQTLVAIAVADYAVFGILSSRAHVQWATSIGGTLEDRPRYTIASCFEAFTFPDAAEKEMHRISQLGEALHAHRKRQQELHPKLTVTAMYNVLEKLRRGEALTNKEKVTHEQGLVSVLKQIHDDLDAAVFDAYGWPDHLTDDEIIERLVALNHERAEEEKRGIIRWLRPEFQAREGRAVATQQEMVIGVTAEEGTEEEVREWPAKMPDQLSAVRSLMYSAARNWTTKSLAKEFRGAKRKDVENVLEALEALGIVVSHGEGDEQIWAALRPVPLPDARGLRPEA